MSYVIDMLCLEKAEQAASGQIIFEQTRGDLDKIKQMVDDPTLYRALGPICVWGSVIGPSMGWDDPANVELAVAGLAKLEPATAGPKVKFLVVSLSALF